jgi:biopolymer transport protein ExbD
MAGAASEDDAVSLNVTPLIDIIFCLCIFFICSFHFKELQGKIDSWLPTGEGVQQGPASNALEEEIRVFLRSRNGATELAFGARIAATPAELEALVKAAWDERTRSKKPKVVIDAEPSVPWRDVVEVLDRARVDEIDRVEFAQPLPAAR